MSPSSHPKAPSGFSLLETAIYLAIAVVITTAVTGIYAFTVTEQSRLAELEAITRSSRAAHSILLREIRAADRVVSPIPGATSTTLTLAMATGTTPVTISLSDSRISIVRGASSSPRIIYAESPFTEMVFHNASHGDMKGAIRTSLTAAIGSVERHFLMTHSIYAR